MKLVTALLLALSAAGAAQAADAIKAGKWEFSAQIQLPNMPKLPPGVTLPPGVNMGAGGINVTRTSCIDSARPMPADMHRSEQQQGQCKVAKLDSSGGTVHWETTCTPQDGTTVHSEGVAHYDGETMQADLTTTVTGKDGPANVTSQHITGRYLGACDGK